MASVWEAQKMLIIVQGIEILMSSLMAQVDLIKQFKIMDMVIITSFGRRKMSSGANCFDHFSESSGSAVLGQQSICVIRVFPPPTGKKGNSNILMRQ